MDPNDITDPTDWQDTRLPAIAALDAGLRCQICKEFYDSPVITSCSHTFCSLCIRRCLTADQVCPICRSRDEEVRLRKNVAIQELLEAFLALRGALLNIVKEVPAEEIVLETPTASIEHTEALDEPRRGTRSSGRKSHRSTSAQQTATTIEIISIDDDISNDEDYDPLDDDERVERPLLARPAKSTALVDDGLQECPICSKRFKPDFMNQHLDECLNGEAISSTSKKSTILRSTTKPHPSPSKIPTPKIFQPPALGPYTAEEQAKLRLAKLNYTLLKETQLRSKLSDLGLRSIGNKAVLEKRHTEWVNIWNANLDSKKPKSKKQLLAELDQLEKEQMRPKANPTKKDGFSDQQWTKKHESDFADLVKQAKAKRRKVSDDQEKKEGEDEEGKEGTELQEGQEVNMQENQAVPVSGHDSPYFTVPTLPATDKEMIDINER